jgi:DNA-binding LacI/PurR family transcriptional regulator
LPAFGRTSNKLSSQIRDQIRNGVIENSGYLPTIRDLSREHGLAVRTVQRALEALEREGLIVSEPRRGYRVLSRSHDPNRGMPLAYVLSTHAPVGQWDSFHVLLSQALQTSAAQRGWSLLAVTAGGRGTDAIIEQLRMARACGAILDTLDAELIAKAAYLGLPVVMVDAWVEQTSVDIVLQDDYRGGFLAAEHLLRKGHTDIAWLGPLRNTPHGRERFGGAAAALAASGHAMKPERIFETVPQNIERDATQLLSRSDRPRAVLCLFRDVAVGLASAARAKGLVLGRDLDLVGWCAEEIYEKEFKAILPAGQVPAAICWKMETMAESALRRLVERRESPELPALRIQVPVRLVTEDRHTN